jgi:hypothetical protein
VKSDESIEILDEVLPLGAAPPAACSTVGAIVPLDDLEFAHHRPRKRRAERRRHPLGTQRRPVIRDGQSWWLGRSRTSAP